MTAARTARRVAMLAGALLLAPLAARADAIGDAERATQSWGATVQMATRAWLAHAVPSHYLRRTLGAAREALLAARAPVARSASRSADAAASLASLDGVDAWCAALQQALARDERPRVAALLAQAPESRGPRVAPATPLQDPGR